MPAETARVPEIEYPCSDGEPLAETFLHVQAIILLLQMLEDLFEHNARVFIAANMFWYWEKDRNDLFCAPDIMVVKGVARGNRRSFMSFREGGAVPQVIVEFISERTWRYDRGDKALLYASLGVREYFLFDVEGVHLQPALQGFRLKNGRYEALEFDVEQRLYSEELAVYLRSEGEMLRLLDGRTGRPLPTRAEANQLERQRAEAAEQLAERQRQLKEQERQLKDQEIKRADALAEEVARLKSLLEQRDTQAGNAKQP